MSAIFKLGKNVPMTSPALVPVLEEIDRQSQRHKVKVIVQRDSERSGEQNSALWAVAYKTIGEHCGLWPDEYESVLHREMCKRYFGTVKAQAGPFGDCPRRTTTRNENGERDVISKLDMANFYAFVQQWAAENLDGLYIPDPHKDWRSK